jgi:hypothetical protein
VDGGARTLSAVTRAVLDELPPDERYVATGRVAEAVTKLAKAASAREREWTEANAGIWIEEWSVERSAKGA